MIGEKLVKVYLTSHGAYFTIVSTDDGAISEKPLLNLYIIYILKIFFLLGIRAIYPTKQSIDTKLKS